MSVIALFKKKKAVTGNAGGSVVSEPPVTTGNPQVDALLQSGRACELLNPTSTDFPEDRLQAAAWTMLEREMALVPSGTLHQGEQKPVIQCSSFYLDRFAVSNEQFAQFVADSGYTRTELWPQDVWPNLLQFVDQTGSPGPRFWKNGRPAKHDLRKPVVGVCWYEALAYATWASKRLPTSSEWQHACTWCGRPDGGNGELRYPWGNSFDPEKANTWQSECGEIVDVDSFYDGSTPNGVYQLIGNVWEWVANAYRCGSARDDVSIMFTHPMAEIRGGAFDTYFEDQASAQFRTGLPLLYRRANVGFRCCVSVDAIRIAPDPSAFEN